MKKFKRLSEELFSEGNDMYPADDMTMKEVKIACYAAQNILDRLENGAMIQRWQISAIVKASEELASVYTSMSADEEDDMWDDEDDKDPMYVGFEYPSMYGEEVELDEVSDLQKAFIDSMQKKLKKSSSLRDPNAKTAREEDRIAKMLAAKAKMKKEEVELDEISYRDSGAQNMMRASRKADKEVDKMRAQAAKRAEKEAAKKKPVEEETDFKVSVDGLPDMYVKAGSPGEVKNNLRKVVKNPDMIKNIERIAKTSLQKMFRDKASGKEEVSEELDLGEGYNDPIHRKYISDTVHDYVAKDDPKHEKIVDHLHKAKNFGEKTVDSLSDHAGISYGAAKSITKDVASNLKANFGSPSKPQTQAQRVGAYLKQKHIGPR